MKLKYIFVAIGLLLALMACKQTESDTRTGLTPAIGERMQMVPFKMPSLTDKAILDSKQLEGQVLLVTFFCVMVSSLYSGDTSFDCFAGLL